MGLAEVCARASGQCRATAPAIIREAKIFIIICRSFLFVAVQTRACIACINRICQGIPPIWENLSRKINQAARSLAAGSGLVPGPGWMDFTDHASPVPTGASRVPQQAKQMKEHSSHTRFGQMLIHNTHLVIPPSSKNLSVAFSEESIARHQAFIPAKSNGWRCRRKTILPSAHSN